VKRHKGTEAPLDCARGRQAQRQPTFAQGYGGHSGTEAQGLIRDNNHLFYLSVTINIWIYELRG